MNTDPDTSAISRSKIERLMDAARDERARYLGEAMSRLCALMRRTPLRWAGTGTVARFWLIGAAALVAAPYPSYAWLEGPEPALLGLITKNSERDTLAYVLLDDPDVAGTTPVFGSAPGYHGPVLADEEKNSWAYPVQPAGG